jgi:hypothetical protein
MTILGIEFDQTHFLTIDACREWLVNTVWDYLLQLKTFRPLKKKTPVFLISEKGRPVWSWYSDKFPLYTHYAVARPNSHVVIIDADPKATLFPAELMPLLQPETIRKRELKAKAEAERKIKKASEREKNNEKRKADLAALKAAGMAPPPRKRKEKALSSTTSQPKKNKKRRSPLPVTADSDEIQFQCLPVVPLISAPV